MDFQYYEHLIPHVIFGTSIMLLKNVKILFFFLEKKRLKKDGKNNEKDRDIERGLLLSMCPSHSIIRYLFAIVP